LLAEEYQNLKQVVQMELLIVVTFLTAAIVVTFLTAAIVEAVNQVAVASLLLLFMAAMMHHR
ncbi:hypothetical protein, partial [Microcoleus sp. N9_A1]|uniref:hypothetical protein n=1 Tax=Microcoleus sp. N9_A1 TaxID=3055380 RepID=UPI002FD72694